MLRSAGDSLIIKGTIKELLTTKEGKLLQRNLNAQSYCGAYANAAFVATKNNQRFFLSICYSQLANF